MMPEKADQMLSSYKMCLGRYQYLMALLPELREEAARWKVNLASDLAGVNAQNMDGMPHGTAVSNPTERLGIMLADGYAPEGLKELNRQIEQYEKELNEKSVVVHFVEAWLSGLTDKERWIIEAQVIDGAYWREVMAEYRKRYGEDYSREGLKKIRDAAMAKIHQMAM